MTTISLESSSLKTLQDLKEIDLKPIQKCQDYQISGTSLILQATNEGNAFPCYVIQTGKPEEMVKYIQSDEKELQVYYANECLGRIYQMGKSFEVKFIISSMYHLKINLIHF